MAEVPREIIAALIAAAPHAAFASVVQSLRALVNDEAAWWGVVAPCCLDYHLQRVTIASLAIQGLQHKLPQCADWSRADVGAMTRLDTLSLVVCKATHLLSWVQAYYDSAQEASPSSSSSLSAASLEEGLRCHFRDMTSFLLTAEDTTDQVEEDVFSDLAPSYGFENLHYVFIDASRALYVELDPTTLRGVRVIPFAQDSRTGQVTPRGTLTRSCSVDDALYALEAYTRGSQGSCGEGDLTIAHRLCRSLRTALHTDIDARATKAPDGITCHVAGDVIPVTHSASSLAVHMVVAMVWNAPAQGWGATYSAHYTLAPQTPQPDAAVAALYGNVCISAVMQETTSTAVWSSAQYMMYKPCATQSLACCPPTLLTRDQTLLNDDSAGVALVEETVQAVMQVVLQHSNVVQDELVTNTGGYRGGGARTPWLRYLYDSLRRRLPLSGMLFDHRRPSLAVSAVSTLPAD